MRALEALLLVLLLPAVLFSFSAQRSGWSGLLAIVAAVLAFPLHAFIEGMHWQMGPAYAAIPFLLLSQSGMLPGPTARWICIALAATFLIVSIGFSWALPMFKLPMPSGPYPVGTRMLNLIDVSRAEMHRGAWPGNREVIVQLWYPAANRSGRRAKYRKRSETTFKSSYQAVLDTDYFQDAPVAEGRFPITMYNPAWHGSRHRGTFMTQELASHGFIVAAISHPYNSSLAELSNGKIAHPSYDEDLGFSLDRYIPLDERFAMADAELAIQTEDCRFVLDELDRFDRTSGHPLFGHLSMDRIGAFGYSFGGAVSVELAHADPRVSAALELDGVLHGSAAQHGLEKPLMLIDSNWIVAPHEHIDEQDTRLIETARMWKIIADTKARVLSRCGGMRVIVDGIGHVDFTDQIHMSPFRRLSRAGSLPPRRVARILNAYAVAFFQQTLCNIEQKILKEGSQPFPEATLTVWRPSENPCSDSRIHAAG